MSGCRYVDLQTYDKWTRRAKVENGDILLTREAPIGEVGYVQNLGNVFLGQRIMQYRANSDLADRRFLFYALRSPNLRHQFSAHDGSGSVVSHIRVADCSEFLIPLAPYKQQVEIGQLLGALDDKIDLNRRMNETLEHLARALFKDWFVDFGPTKAKQEGREAYLEADLWALFPERLNEMGMPDGWSERRVEDVLELVYGKALKAEARVEGPVPVYGSGGVTGYHNTALAEGPSVVVGRKGTVGSLYWEDRSFFPIDTVFYVNPKAPLTFCFYLLQTLGLDNMNTDAAVPGLNRNNVYRLLVPWGPESLRQAFHKIVEPLRQRIKANVDESQTLTRTRDLLLPKLMSGELRVRDAEKALGDAL